MKILALSHSAVAGPYREKWRILSRRKGWKLTLAIPELWPEGGLGLRPDISGEKQLDVRILGVRLPGRVGFFSHKGLKGLCAGLKPDLIYAEEEPYSLAALQALHFAEVSGAKFAFFSWENLKRTYKPPLNWVQRRVLKNADAGVFGNSESLSLYRSLGFRGRAAQIPQYGVDTKLFKPARAPKKFVAGYVGRLSPEKGVDLFIEAVAACRIQGRVVGRGPELGRLKKLALNLGAKIEFIDFVPFEKRHTIYHGLSALVLPSRTTRNWKEQFGRVLIEAMACGVPCIGSDSGAIPEVIGKAGLLFPEGDAGALAAALQRIQKQRGLGGPARRRAVKHFEERLLARRLGDFLESVIER